MKRIIAFLAILLTSVTALATCTATERNADYAEDNGSNNTASKTVTINGLGDVVAFTAYCYPSCTFVGVTLGSQSAVTNGSLLGPNIPNGPGTGQGGIFYITSTTVSGSQSMVLTVSGSHSDVQVSYIDFSLSAGCVATHHVDSPIGSCSSSCSSTLINAPSITPSAGDLLFSFTWTNYHINSVNSPWSCPTYAGTGTCEFNTTINAAGYILSAASGATANNVTDQASSDLWEAIITSFTLSASSGNIYYISKSAGLDTRTSTQAQNSATPWAHLPGMHGATSNAAAYTPVAGDSFILKGGDTWVASDLGATLFQNGSATNCVMPYGSGATSSCIYIGVDQTYYTGASWTRPIWTCGGTACGSGAGDNFLYMGCRYCVVDNIEMTGLYDNAGSGGKYIFTDQEYVDAEHIYAHGWSHGVSTTSIPAAVFACDPSADGCLAVMFHDNVIDGSDTSKDMMRAMLGGGVARFYNNEVSYIVSAMDTVAAGFVYGNTVENLVVSADGSHCNGLSTNSLNGNYYIFNNVIRHDGNHACVRSWMGQTDGANPSAVGYFFNNVMYDQTDNNNAIDITPSGGTGSNFGTYYIFNNSFECGNSGGWGGCTYGATGGHPYTGYFRTNVAIVGGLSSICDAASCPNESNEKLYASVTAAVSGGYNNTSNTYALSPTGSAAGIGTGTNNSSICTTLTSIDALTGAACQSDTQYGVAYSTSTHTISAGRITNARPPSGAWDVGAYQFSGSPAPSADMTFTGLHLGGLTVQQ